MTGSFRHSFECGTTEIKKVVKIALYKSFSGFSSLLYFALVIAKRVALRYLLLKNRIKKSRNYTYALLFLRRRLVMFTMIMVPIGGGAGIIYNNDGEHVLIYPNIESAYVLRDSEEITIAYEKPVKDIDYRTGITIEPTHAVVVLWNDDHDRLTIVPQTDWHVQKRYTLTLPDGAYADGTTLPASTFLFDTTAYPRVEKTTLRDGQKNAVFSLDQSLEITFEQPLIETHVEFVLSPALAVEITPNAGRSIFTITPTALPKVDTTYTVTTFMRPRTAEHKNLLPVHTLSFTTLPAHPDEWPEDFEKRLAVAKKYTRPQEMKEKYVDVNLDAQITTLFEDGHFVANFISSPGIASTPTPTGEYEIHNKDEYALSAMFQMYLPYWMAFTADGRYGFHDLPVWPAGHPDLPTGGKESTKSIGVANSPGCVRHDTSSSKTIYDWTPVGTKVIIY